jgi:hypothetical protein
VLEYHGAIKQGQLSNLILGVSSPLLAKNFEKFHAILRMDSAYYQDKKLNDPKTEKIDQKVLRNKCSRESSNALLLNNGLEKVQLQITP